MKKSFYFLTTVLILFSAFVFFSGCDKDDNYYSNGNGSDSGTNNNSGLTEHYSTCSCCDGVGYRCETDYVSTYGLDGPDHICTYCGERLSYGTVHLKKTCICCDGTGIDIDYY